MIQNVNQKISNQKVQTQRHAGTHQTSSRQSNK